MAKAKPSAHLIELAKRGAEVRARFLVDELQLLFSAFPHLSDAVSADDLPVSFLLKAGAEQSAATSRRRKPMSAASRKAVGERMRKYWAARRAADEQ